MYGHFYSYVKAGVSIFCVFFNLLRIKEHFCELEAINYTFAGGGGNPSLLVLVLDCMFSSTEFSFTVLR